MKYLKKLDYVFLGVMILAALACIIHVVVAYVLGANNPGTSFPASIAFFLIIPYAFGILIVLVVWLIVRNKANRK